MLNMITFLVKIIKKHFWDIENIRDIFLGYFSGFGIFLSLLLELKYLKNNI